MAQIDRLSNVGAIVRNNAFHNCGHIHFKSIGGQVVGNTLTDTSGIGILIWVRPWDEGSVGLRDVVVSQNTLVNQDANRQLASSVLVGPGTSNISVHGNRPPQNADQSAAVQAESAAAAAGKTDDAAALTPPKFHFYPSASSSQDISGPIGIKINNVSRFCQACSPKGLTKDDGSALTDGCVARLCRLHRHRSRRPRAGLV